MTGALNSKLSCRATVVYSIGWIACCSMRRSSTILLTPISSNDHKEDRPNYRWNHLRARAGGRHLCGRYCLVRLSYDWDQRSHRHSENVPSKQCETYAAEQLSALYLL